MTLISSVDLSSKIILDLLYDYAIKNEVLSPEAKKIMDYVDISDVQVEDSNKVKRRVYTQEEINTLWQLEDDFNAKIALVLLYTGMRSGELYNLRLNDIHIDERYIDVKHAKTEAGIRQVPICEKIVSLLEDLMYASTSEKLFERNKNTVFYYQMLPFLKSHNTVHTTHNTRHTFITRMVELGIDSRVLNF